MNQLTKQQEEILRITQEECGEVVQIISKACRFGLDDCFSGESNRERLTSEMGDLLCMVDLAIRYNIVDQDAILSAKTAKEEKLKKWSNIFTGDSNVRN